MVSNAIDRSKNMRRRFLENYDFQRWEKYILPTAPKITRKRALVGQAKMKYFNNLWKEQDWWKIDIKLKMRG